MAGMIAVTPKSEVENSTDSIKVCVRIRPILGGETEESIAWHWENKSICPTNASQLPYTFDHLFSSVNSNEDIFNQVVKNVVSQSLNGYNGSIFTYGQTSSGKTYTMNGNHSQPGLIPLAISYCFKSIQDSFPGREFLFRMSYIEVYNEEVKDLLNSSHTNIKIQHDPKLGTIMSGAKEVIVKDAEEAIHLLKRGEIQRHIFATEMNEVSSRAHTLFKFIIESRRVGTKVLSAESPLRLSYLNLIDLAGSENAKMTNSKGVRFREATYINKSLLTLSLIIQRLSEEKPNATKKQHLPYRDSKLTRLLSTSLSGNARIAIICTVAPTLRCADETRNTLKFAARAKKIKTHPTITEFYEQVLLKATLSSNRLIRLETLDDLSEGSNLSEDEMENYDVDDEGIFHKKMRTLESSSTGSSFRAKCSATVPFPRQSSRRNSLSALPVLLEGLRVEAPSGVVRRVIATMSVSTQTETEQVREKERSVSPCPEPIPNSTSCEVPQSPQRIEINDSNWDRNMLTIPGSPFQSPSLSRMHSFDARPSSPTQASPDIKSSSYIGKLYLKAIHSGTSFVKGSPFLASGTTTMDSSQQVSHAGSCYSITESIDTENKAEPGPGMGPEPGPGDDSESVHPSLMRVFSKGARDSVSGAVSFFSDRKDGSSVWHSRGGKDDETDPPDCTSDSQDGVDKTDLKDDTDTTGVRSSARVIKTLGIVIRHVQKLSAAARNRQAGLRSPPSHAESNVTASLALKGELSQRVAGLSDRQYIMKEVEKKDDLIALLSERLRTIENSQNRWVLENENLQAELHDAIAMNEAMSKDTKDVDQSDRSLKMLKVLAVIVNCVYGIVVTTTV